jgi:hypothetical protein
MLLLPGGAGAATPAEIAGQTSAGVNGVVENAGAAVGKVTAQAGGEVDTTLAATRQAVPDPPEATPAGTSPAPGAGLAATVERTVAAAQTVATTATGGQATASAVPASKPRASARSHGAKRQREAAPATVPSPDTLPADRATSAAIVPGEVATEAVRDTPRELPSTSQSPARPSPAGPAPAGSSAGGAASSASSAGGFAVLLMALCLAASALRTRVPRFDEIGRPLPLVFAIERPG